MRNKNRISKILFITIFFLMISVIPAISFIDEDREVSTLENRSLEQLPVINKQRFFSGEFFTSFEKYFADQLYGRDTIMNLYSSIQTNILGKRKINNIILGDDGYLLPYKDYVVNNDVSKSGDKILDALLTLDKSVEEYKGQLYYFYIPHKSDMYDDKYPSYYENGHDIHERSEKVKMEKLKKAGINIVDATSTLEEAKANDEYIYFKTDHHYTFKGAYYAYSEFLSILNERNSEYNLSYPSWNSMIKVRSDKKFIGSYLKQTGNIGDNRGDYFEYALPNDFPNFERFENGDKSDNTIFRDKEYTDDKIDYEYILGNRPNTVIKTNRSNLPNILYIGYSYTNDLEAMSIYNFNEVHSIDPRYWKGNISDYIKENKPDIVVVVRDDLYEGNKENVAKIK